MAGKSSDKVRRFRYLHLQRDVLPSSGQLDSMLNPIGTIGIGGREPCGLFGRDESVQSSVHTRSVQANNTSKDKLQRRSAKNTVANLRVDTMVLEIPIVS